MRMLHLPVICQKEKVFSVCFLKKQKIYGILNPIFVYLFICIYNNNETHRDHQPLAG